MGCYDDPSNYWVEDEPMRQRTLDSRQVLAVDVDDFVPATQQVQIFVAEFQVLGDGVTVLDERNAHIAATPETPVIPID